MSNSVNSLQTINAQHQTEQTVQPPKKQPTPPPQYQDKVTISDSAKQALAKNAKAVSGDVDHDGDSH
jgi:hypothetical protein